MEKGQVIKTTNGLKIGDWIYLEQYSTLYKGYVVDILNQTTIKMYCVSYVDELGKKFDEYKEYGTFSTNTNSYRIFKETKQFTFKDLENKSYVIDMAIDTKDKDWFRELVN